MKNYPRVKIPKDLLVISDPIPVFPSKPIKPSPPEKPKLEDENGGCMGTIAYFMFLPIIMGFFLTIGYLTGEGEAGFGIIFLIGGLIIFFLFKPSSDIAQRNSITLENHEKSLKVYQNIEIPKYNAEVELYKKKIVLLHDDNFRKKKSLTYLSEILDNAPKPEKNNYISPKGISEKFFGEYLIRRFGNKILIDHTITPKDNIFSYTPDFIYHDSKVNLSVAIEIDEPYVGSTKKPIHFIDGSDDERDKFFLRRNWVIVRFAEKQIWKQPESCVNHIAKVINKILPGHEELNKSVEIVTKTKVWTKQESDFMAFTDVRQSYIPENLKMALKSETLKKIEELDEINEYIFKYKKPRK